jgi:hypothetical protein
VAQAAAALAATLETAQKGVIYEHDAQSPLAQGLTRALAGLIEEIRAQGTKIFDGEAAITLRAIEQGARDTAKAMGDDAPTSYLTLVGRLLQVNRAAEPGAPPPPTGPAIILP